MKMIFFNRYFDKNRLKALVLWSLTKSGEKTTIDLVENLKDIGFHYATHAGLSLSIDDLKIPPTKAELILESENIVRKAQTNYEIGNVTSIERFQQLIDVWHRTSEVLKQNVIQHFRATDILNPVYMMAFSGARGNISQVRQLVGMRGLMADPQGQILDFPIRSNFREGLTLTEYVISCYGARKGLVDTALRTANSGYLTRRLVDVAQHMIIRQEDCGTKTGIFVTDMKDGKKIILSLQKRLVGRVLAEKIPSIASKNQDISPALAAKIAKLRNQVLVRSPLTCEAKISCIAPNTICQLCYGWSLAHGSLVSLGEAVGVLAAQSIGEPGTQLTMRTFHTGGVFSGDVMQEIRSPIDGYVRYESPLQGSLIRTLHGKIAFLTRIEGKFSISSTAEQSNQFDQVNYQIPSASILFVKHLEKVAKRELITEFSSFVSKNNQGIQAKFNLNAEKEGQIYFDDVLLVLKREEEGDSIKTALKYGSIWILAGKLYEAPIRSSLFTKAGDLIDTNSILNEAILASPYSGFLQITERKTQKYTFLNKKLQKNTTSFDLNKNSSEIEFLNHFLIGKKDISLPEKNTVNISWKNKESDITIKKQFINLFIKEVYFKKFGYFITLPNANNIAVFINTSLSKSFENNNELSLQIYNRQKLKDSGITYHQKKSFIFQQGQYFFIKEKVYKRNKKNVLPAKQLNKDLTEQFTKTTYLEKNPILFSIKNLQGNKKRIRFYKNDLLFINTSVCERKIYQQRDNTYQTKKISFYRENPYRQVSKYLNILPNQLQAKFTSKNFNNVEIIQVKNKTVYKKCFIPSLVFHKFSLLFRNSNYMKNKAFDINQKSKTSEIDFFNYKITSQSGWISLPVKNFNNFKFHKKLLLPGFEKTSIQFDQLFVVIKIVKLKNRLFLFKQTKYLKKARYINNKLFRFDKIHQKEIKVTSPAKQRKISRNSIILTNYFLNISFLFLINKGKELNYKNQIKKNFLLKKLTNNLYNLNFYKINSFISNKQKHTKLHTPFNGIDIQINSKWNKNQNISTTKIYYRIGKSASLKQSEITLLFPLNLKISISQQIKTLNYLVPNKLSTEKVLVTKEKEVFEQNNLSFTSFFSPYNAEITSQKTDSTGKEKSLLLTNKDQISFATTNENSVIKIGQLVRSGEQVSRQNGIQESGQIIQIDKNSITIRKAQPILFSAKGVFHVDNGDLVEKNTPLITLFYQKLKTEDIVQGIPKIEELFEARQTKEGELLQENLHSKLNFFFNFYKQRFLSQEATRKSIEKIQHLLVNNVQKVYQSQGVTIADKHIEIIVRQMTTKVKITESGRTGLLRGELTDLERVESINLGIEYLCQHIPDDLEIVKAEYEPIILGITKAALETESFISASSFQETTRILSRAAIGRKTDFLRGLKENVILGHLIPAGTGFKRFLDPSIKISSKKKKLSWLNYNEIVKLKKILTNN